MEAKRIKLDTSSSATTLSTIDHAANNDVTNSRQLINAVGSGDLERVMIELTRLRKFLATKERVFIFIQNNKPCFNAIITFIISESKNIFHPASDGSKTSSNLQSPSVLREAFSLLANACHLSVLACVEVRTRDAFLRNLYVQLLKASHSLVPLPLKATIIRLLGNLCELKETATVIALNAALLNQITLLLDFDHQQVADQVLRLIRLLSKRRAHSKYIMDSNSCYHIAKYIVHRNKKQSIFENRSDILQILNFLLKFHPSSTGRQLSNCSEFMDMCLNHLLTFNTHDPDDSTSLAKHWLEFILHAAECSTDICTIFGQANAIEKVLERERDFDQLNDINCRFLCAFTRHTYYRTHMRENGSLSRILDRLEPVEYDAKITTKNKRISHLRLQCSILEHLRFFLYEHSLGDAIRHPSFMRITLHHVCHFLDENTTNCRIRYIDSDGIPDDSPFYNLKQEGYEEQILANPDEQPKLLCKNYSTSSVCNIYSPSLSPSSVQTWSPPSMFPSTSRFSPTHNTTSPSASPPQFFITTDSISCYSPTSFSLDDFMSDAEELRKETLSPIINEAATPEELEPDDPTAIIKLNDYTCLLEKQQPDGHEDREEEKLRERIVRCILMLIAQHSHTEESQSIFLLKREVIDMLLRYISDAPELDNRLIRAVGRLARHQTGLHLLLEMDFQQMIIFRLIRRECILTRNARPCPRCDRRYDVGRMLLSDFSLIADSPMGWHILLKLRMDAAKQKTNSREQEFDRLKALMAALVLIRRDEQRRSRFYHTFRPVHNLLDSIAEFLLHSKRNGQRLDESSKEGIFCCEIVATLALFFSQQFNLDLPKSISILYSTSDRREKEEQLAKVCQSCVLKHKVHHEQAVGNIDGEPEQILKFRNNQGQHLIEVPKHELCTSNEYFSGMFGNEFIERVECRDEFIFDANAENLCSEEDFIKFLHFSIGCSLRSECVRVDDAECCVALLYLADKYLCTRLLDHLLADGIAARFINGENLKLFLPLVLSVPTIGAALKHICMLVLFRYSNNTELLSTLRHIVECDPGTGSTIDVLSTMIREFLATYRAEGL